MDEVNQAAVSDWALQKLVTALREFREGSAPFHVVVSCFSMCETVGIDRLVLNSFARGSLVGVPVSSEVEPDLLAMSVYGLALPVRVQNVLVADRIQTVGQLVAFTERELLRVPCIGKLALRQVRDALGAIGLELRGG